MGSRLEVLENEGRIKLVTVVIRSYPAAMNVLLKAMKLQNPAQIKQYNGSVAKKEGIDRNTLLKKTQF